MPRIPKESLKKRVQAVIKNSKNKIYTYGLIVGLVIEIASVLICEVVDDYMLFWYPMLTQLVFAIYVLSILFTPPKVSPCIREKIAMGFLVAYYTYGFLATLFKFSGEDYSINISGGLLVISFLLIIYTLKKK